MTTMNPNADPLTGRQRLMPAEPMLDEVAPPIDVGATIESAQQRSMDPTSDMFDPTAAMEDLDVAAQEMDRRRSADAQKWLDESQGIFPERKQDRMRGGTATGIDLDEWIEGAKRRGAGETVPGVEPGTPEFFEQMKLGATSAFGSRPDGTPKGMGWLGPLRNARGEVVSEYSVGVNIDGRDMDIPTLVPTLNRDEIQEVLRASEEGRAPSDAVIRKASLFARRQIASGASVWAPPTAQSPDVGFLATQARAKDERVRGNIFEEVTQSEGGEGFGAAGSMRRRRVETLPEEAQSNLAFIDLKKAVRRRVAQEEALRRGDWDAWIQRELEKKAIEVQRTGGAGVGRAAALAVPSGILSAVQSISGFASLVGSGLEAWSEDWFGFDRGTTGESISNFFNNTSGLLELVKQNAAGSTDQTAQIINAIGDGAGQLAASIGIAAITGGAGAIPAFIISAGAQAGGSAYNQAYLQALSRGLDPEAARAFATVDGVLYGTSSAVLNAIPGAALFGRIGGVATNQALNTLARASVAASVKKLSSSPYLVKKVLAGGLAEGLQEVSEDAVGNMLQVLAWNLAGGDPAQREVYLKKLAEGDPDTLYNAMLSFVGGAGAGSVGAKVVQALDLKRFQQERKDRVLAWKAFEQGLASDVKGVARPRAAAGGNPADLSQQDLENAARGTVVEDRRKIEVLPEDAISELRRRGLAVPPDAVKPAPKPAPAEPAAPAAPTAPGGTRSPLDGLPLVNPADRKEIAIDEADVDFDKVAANDEAEIEKFVGKNQQAVGIVLATPGAYLTEANLKRLFGGTASGDRMAAALADPAKRKALTAALYKAGQKTGALKVKEAPTALDAAGEARLAEIDAVLDDEAKRPTGPDLAKLLRERRELALRAAIGVKEEELDPLSPHEKKQLDLMKEALGKMTKGTKDYDKLAERMRPLERRLKSKRTYAPPPLPTVTPATAGKVLSGSETKRLAQVAEFLTDGRPLKPEQRLAYEKEYADLKSREGLKPPEKPAAPAPKPKPTPATKPTATDLGPLSPYEKRVLQLKRDAYFDPATKDKDKTRLKEEIDLLEERARLPEAWKAPALPDFTPETTGRPLNKEERENLDKLTTALTDGRPIAPETRVQMVAKWQRLKAREGLKASAKPSKPAERTLLPTEPEPTPAPAPEAPAPEPAIELPAPVSEPVAPPPEPKRTRSKPSKPAAPAPEAAPTALPIPKDAKFVNEHKKFDGTPTGMLNALISLTGESPDVRSIRDDILMAARVPALRSQRVIELQTIVGRMLSGEAIAVGSLQRIGLSPADLAILVGKNYGRMSLDGKSFALNVKPPETMTSVAVRQYPGSREMVLGTIAETQIDNAFGFVDTLFNRVTAEFKALLVDGGATEADADAYAASIQDEIAAAVDEINGATGVPSATDRLSRRRRFGWIGSETAYTELAAGLRQALNASKTDSELRDAQERLYALLSERSRGFLAASGLFAVNDDAKTIRYQPPSLEDVARGQALYANRLAIDATLETTEKYGVALNADGTSPSYASISKNATRDTGRQSTNWLMPISLTAASRATILVDRMSGKNSVVASRYDEVIVPAALTGDRGAFGEAPKSQFVPDDVTVDEVIEATRAVQEYLATGPSAAQTGGMSHVPSHMVAIGLDRNAAPHLNSKVPQVFSLSPVDVSFANAETMRRLNWGPDNPLTAAHSMGAILLTGTSRNALGWTIHGSNASMRMQAVVDENGTRRFVPSTADASVPLGPGEFYMEFPIIAVDVRDASSMTTDEKAKQLDTTYHEAWHRTQSPSSASHDERKAEITRRLEAIRSKAPELFDLIVSQIETEVRASYSAELVPDELTVRLLAKFSALATSDPAELKAVLADLRAEATKTNSVKELYEFLMETFRAVGESIFRAAQSMLSPGASSWVQYRFGRVPSAGRRVALGENAQEIIDSASDSERDVVAKRLMRLGMDLMAITDPPREGTGGQIDILDAASKRFRTLQSKAASIEERQQAGLSTLDEIIALIVAVNEQYRPALAHRMLVESVGGDRPTGVRTTVDQLSSGPTTKQEGIETRPSRNPERLEVLRSAKLPNDPASDEDPTTFVAEATRPRPWPAKTIGRARLTLTGIGTRVLKSVSRVALEDAFAAGIASRAIRRGTNFENWARRNVDQFAGDASQRTGLHHGDEIYETKEYRSLTDSQKSAYSAAVRTGKSMKEEDFRIASGWNGAFPAQHEQVIREFVAASGMKGKVRANYEFLIRLAVAGKFARLLNDNRSRRTDSEFGDPGWEIPEITDILVADGTIRIRTSPIPWSLQGPQETTYGTRGAEKAAIEKRNEAARARSRKRGAAEIVRRVRALQAKADAGDPDASRILRENRWYDTILERLIASFGNQHRFFSELLAALSPQTPADANYRYALEAIVNFTRGKYDALLKDYSDWVTDQSRLDKVAKLNRQIERRRQWILARIRRTKNNVPLLSDERYLSLVRARNELSVYRGKTPFFEAVLTQGERFPANPYENRFGETVTPKTQVFSHFGQVLSAYGPKRPDFRSDAEFEVARQAFAESVVAANQTAFDADGNLIPGATIVVERKFGANSRHALNVMAGLWLKNVSSPKVHTFFANLTGLSSNPTIDLWAARMVRESMGMKRIPAFAEVGVRGTPEDGDIDLIGGDYGFAQRIIEDAAAELGMRGSNLQALLWFHMKDVWSRNGWTSAQGAAGSFERSFDRDPMTLVDATIDLGEGAEGTGELSRFIASLRQDTGVVRVQMTPDRRAGDGSIALSMTTLVRSFDMNGFAESVMDLMRKSGTRKSVTITRTLHPDATASPNARPSFVAPFRRNLSLAEASAIATQIGLQAPGFRIHLEHDNRATQTGAVADESVVGMRIVYAAETDEAMRRNAMSASDETTASHHGIMARRTDAMRRALQSLHQMRIISDAARMLMVEAIVIGQEGVSSDQRGVDAFTDYRRSEPGEPRSVLSLAAEAVGLSGRSDAVPSEGGLASSGPAGYDVRGIADTVVPPEVDQAHRRAVEGHFPDDGPDPREAEMAREAQAAAEREARSISRSASRPDAETTPIPAPMDTDIPLPPGFETADGGLLARVKQWFNPTDVTIKGGKKPGDLGMVRRWVIPLLNSAWSSDIRRVRQVAEDIVATDLERARVTQSIVEKGNDLYASLPKEWRKDGGAPFYRLMDRYYDPEKPNGDPQWVDADGTRLPDRVIDVLREFKRIDEQQRQGIIAAKREAAAAVVGFMSAKRLVKVARENGARWRTEVVRWGPRKNDFTVMIVDDDTGLQMYPDEARDIIVRIMVPDDWGRQFAHVYHAFFGAYEGFWYSKSAYREAIAAGDDEAEAKRKARRSIAMDGGTATAATEAEMVRRLRQFRKNPPPGIPKEDVGGIEIRIQTYVPPDVVRVSGRQYDVLRRQIQEAADVESEVASEMLRGKIGRAERKQRFYAPLLQRKGKEGFDMDFMRAWGAQTSGYYKWLYFNALRRRVTEPIDDLKRQGYVGWAAHLADALEYTTTFRQSQFEQAMDGLVAMTPILRSRAGPMPTRRWLHMIRYLNVIRQLWTVRQQVVNSLQPLQTVYPILGLRRFASYIKRYNGREGRELMAKYGYLRPNGQWYEGKEFRFGAGTGWFGKSYDSIRRVLEKSPIQDAESRNQNYTFFAFYLYAKEELGMTEDQAAKHALLRIAQTQFAFTKANNPIMFRGPTRATLFQYKRFLVSSLGLAHNIVRARDPRTGELIPKSERAMQFVRWMQSFLLMGGLKGLPAFILIDLIAKAFTGEEDAVGWDVHQELRESLGRDWADVIVMGLPAAAGIDISGSIVLFPKPYGRTVYEQIGAFAGGPTVSSIIDLASGLYDKDAVYQSGFEEIWGEISSSSPAVQQLTSLYDALAENAEKYDTQGRLMFRRTVADQVRGVMGFRSVKESIESLEYAKITAMKESHDALKDEIATLLASGMIVEARQKIMHWNAMFPELPLPMNMEDLMRDPSIGRRVKRKIDDRTLDTRQRRVLALNDELADYFVRKERPQEDEE